MQSERCKIYILGRAEKVRISRDGGEDRAWRLLSLTVLLARVGFEQGDGEGERVRAGGEPCEHGGGYSEQACSASHWVWDSEKTLEGGEKAQHTATAMAVDHVAQQLADICEHLLLPVVAEMEGGMSWLPRS